MSAEDNVAEGINTLHSFLVRTTHLTALLRCQQPLVKRALFHSAVVAPVPSADPRACPALGDALPPPPPVAQQSAPENQRDAHPRNHATAVAAARPAAATAIVVVAAYRRRRIDAHHVARVRHLATTAGGLARRPCLPLLAAVH